MTSEIRVESRPAALLDNTHAPDYNGCTFLGYNVLHVYRKGILAMPRLMIELSVIPDEGTTRQFVTTATALGLGKDDVGIVQPLALSCQFWKINREVVVQGALRTAVHLACSRCAEDFVLPLDIALDATYLPAHEMTSERAKELEKGTADVYSYTESVIDLAEMVRDKLLLSIPLQSHCMLGCKGLCPSCGVNRNAISCQCAEDRLGSPFELLNGIRFP